MASLLSPLEMSGLTLNNRVVLAPMTRARAGQDRVPNDLMAEYYRQRASAGLLLTEATTISPQANGWSESAGLYTDAHEAGWKRVVQAVHDAGGVIFCQLWHCGRASHSDFHGGKPAVAPSAIAIQGDHIHTPLGKKPYEAPRALETDEVPAIVADYRVAAERAKRAGFDGVEVHGANGYLIDTFLQSATNQRSDRYGGSLDNRFRFLGEVVDAVSTVFPSGRVGVRLSPNGVYNNMGSPDFRETFLGAAERLSAKKLAYLHVLDGLAFGFHNLGEPLTLADFRGVYDGLLMANCGYTQQTAEAAISSGDADMVSFGRPYISNPDLVERFRNGWPLAEPAEMSVWYSHTPQGYADFPAYQPGSA